MVQRKRAAAKAVKDDLIQIRIPADQKRALEQAAAREGLPLSGWLRRLALREVGLLPSGKG